MEIENSNIDNLKQPKETDNALIKRYEELGGINFQTEDDNRKKVLERTKVSRFFWDLDSKIA